MSQRGLLNLSAVGDTSAIILILLYSANANLAVSCCGSGDRVAVEWPESAYLFNGRYALQKFSKKPPPVLFLPSDQQADQIKTVAYKTSWASAKEVVGAYVLGGDKELQNFWWQHRHR